MAAWCGFFYVPDGAIVGERLMSNEEVKPESEIVEPKETAHVETPVASTKKDENKESNESAAESKKGSNDSFSSEYVKEIRDEAKRHRLKAKELEDKLDETKKQLENQGKEAVDRAVRLNNAFEKRLINAELQIIADKEGLIDKDAFKMVDMSSIKISDEGEVLGLDKIMTDLKANKPYLFKLSSNSNENAKIPHAAESKDTRPTYESKADFDKASREFLATLK